MNINEALQILNDSGYLIEATGPGSPLPKEYQKTIEDAFRQAIISGAVTKHAMNYADRHSDMTSMQRSHEAALKVFDAIKSGNTDIPIVAGYYFMFEDGSYRYTAYATQNWKDIVKFVSTNTEFPPKAPFKLKILTMLAVSNPNEAAVMLKALARKVGKTLGSSVPDSGKTDMKRVRDAARSRDKYIYTELATRVNKINKEAVSPAMREFYAEVKKPESQQDEAKLIDLCKRIRKANAEMNELIDKRNQYAKHLFRNLPAGQTEPLKVLEPCPDEEIIPSIRKMLSLDSIYNQSKSHLADAKKKVAELEAMEPRDEEQINDAKKEVQFAEENAIRSRERYNEYGSRVLGKPVNI
jgi:hypothetical protein